MGDMNDVIEALQWIRQRQHVAEDIARRGQQVGLSLTQHAALHYFRNVLLGLSKLPGSDFSKELFDLSLPAYDIEGYMYDGQGLDRFLPQKLNNLTLWKRYKV